MARLRLCTQKVYAQMRMRLLAVVTLVAATAAQSAEGSSWKPRVRLPTPWTSDVDPTNVLQEYPRPQMQREQWLNLNGFWEFEAAFGSRQDPVEPLLNGQKLSGSILVPFPPESGLSGIAKAAEFMWYRRTFVIPSDWERQQRVLLHFGAIDWQATVYVNGKEVGRHRGGYTRLSLDITDALELVAEGGEHEILVGVWDPTDTEVIVIGKQRRQPGGVFYTACSGIWQTVWLEPVPKTYIAGLHITPDPANSAIRVVVLASEAGEDLSVRVTVRESRRHASGDTSVGASAELVTAVGLGRVVGAALGTEGIEVVVTVPDAKLWSPEAPYLYDLDVELLGEEPSGATGDEGEATDAVLAYFGMRSVGIEKVGGVPRPVLNGEFVFQVGLLDQGFWPDGVYTAPTDEALQWDIKAALQLGFNMLRKHVKVEPDRWYYHADRLGMLVWQDMPSMFTPEGRSSSAAERAQYEVEFADIIAQLRNFPSIITFTVFNEGWGEFDVERVTREMQALDPSRIFDCASGWVDAPVGDYIDMHMYVGPGAPQYTDTRSAVLGEFGGLGVKEPPHMWTQEGLYFTQLVENGTVLEQRYLDMVEQLRDLMIKEGLSAAVYTELTDCEAEINGFITYDRALLKVPNLEAVAAAHAQLIADSRRLNGALFEAPNLDGVATAQAQLITDA